MIRRRTLATTLVAATLLVATSAFAQFAERTIKFTNGVNEDHPVGVGVKRMQEVLNARTGGKMKIAAFWGGSAGGDLPATQALRAGTQEMVCTSSSPLVGIVKELGAFDLPFLFKRSWKHRITVPYWMRNGRYWTDLIVDLREVWQLGDSRAHGSLAAISRHLGLGDKAGNGAHFHELFRTDREAAIAYCLRDVELTQQVSDILIPTY